MSLSSSYNRNQIHLYQANHFFDHIYNSFLSKGESKSRPVAGKRHLFASSVFSQKLRGSYTVEAAVVLPVYLCLCAAVLMFFHVLTAQWDVQVSINKLARTGALYGASMLTGEGSAGGGRSSRSGNAFTAYYSGENGGELSSRSGNGVGVGGLGSGGVDIKIIKPTSVAIPVGMFGRRSIRVVQQARSRRWIGWDPHEFDEGEDSVAYVTESGRVYHLSRGCSYLNPSIRAVSLGSVGGLRNSGGGCYRRCPLCGRRASGTVYITTYGDAYHSSRSCSGLKRTIITMKLDAAKAAYPPCSKCGR